MVVATIVAIPPLLLHALFEGQATGEGSGRPQRHVRCVERHGAGHQRRRRGRRWRRTMRRWSMKALLRLPLPAVLRARKAGVGQLLLEDGAGQNEEVQRPPLRPRGGLGGSI